MNENTGIKSEKDREPMYIRILAKIERQETGCLIRLYCLHFSAFFC